MKRGIILSVLILLIIAPFVVAQTEAENAVTCLENKVQDKTCDTLSLEEKTFSLLALQQCETELLSDSKNNYECWPKSDCSIKQTAQAVFALDSVGTSTTSAKNWLLNQTMLSPKIIQDILHFNRKKMRLIIVFLNQVATQKIQL